MRAAGQCRLCTRDQSNDNNNGAAFNRCPVEVTTIHAREGEGEKEFVNDNNNSSSSGEQGRQTQEGEEEEEEVGDGWREKDRYRFSRF